MRPKPVRVLLVDHAPIIGGVEMMIRDLLTELDPARVAPTVVTDTASPMRGQFGPSVPEAAMPLPRLNRNPLAALDWLMAGIRLARFAWRAGPRALREAWSARGSAGAGAQIIQTFTTRTHLIGALAGRLSGAPVVWRMNDDTLPGSLAAIAGRVPRRIIAVSNYLRAHYGSSLQITDLIPDGVPLPVVIAQAEARRDFAPPIAPETLLVVLVARIVRWKGHGVFLRALAPLAADHPNLHGLMVGGWSPGDNVPGPLGGGEPYQKELEALVQSLGLTGRVTFMGHTNAAARVFAAADVVAHTSTRPEPFGRVIVEAMAAARPVVAAQAGGALEIVEPGVTGLLTPPGDVGALTEALHKMILNTDLRQRMGEAGRARAEREYSLKLMAERFTQVWEEVASRT
jgi:glycosyltransferase involved in cell wall biosynthesis